MTRTRRSTAAATGDDAPLRSELAVMRRALLAWYDRERRRMPWREQPSAYGTVVSEFMLQQTQVATVIPYFEKFLRTFSDFEALAQASEQDVLAAWSGLGYYRRARMLKGAAEEIVRTHGGEVPTDTAALLRLPGFGDYTTAAVGSIVHGLALAAVDGNVRRVVVRLFELDDGDARTRPSSREVSDCEKRNGRAQDAAGSITGAITSLAKALLSARRPGDWNQAMMELGATVCTPRRPECGRCPMRRWCRALAAGRVEELPLPKSAPRLKRVDEVAVAIMRAGRVLVLKRGESGPFASMWELPRLDTREVGKAELTPKAVALELTGLRVTRTESIGRCDSTFTHHRITTDLHRAKTPKGWSVKKQRHAKHRWINPAQFEELASSKAQRRLIDLLIANLAERS